MAVTAVSWMLMTADDASGGAGAGKLAAGTYNVPNYPLCMEVFNEVTFYIQVESVSGAPATWSLTATSQFLIPHTTGDQFALSLGTNPLYLPIDSTQKTALTFEGEDWTVLTNAGGTPQRQKRTYKGFGWGMGLSIVIAMTGGTSPTVNTTVTFVGKS
jgi:hypothetical protein